MNNQTALIQKLFLYRDGCCPIEPTTGATMPVILWLMGVPIGAILLFMLFFHH
jgi:hypothetical protein